MIFYIENSHDSTLLIYQNCMCLEINLPEYLTLTYEYILKEGNLPLTMFLDLRYPHIPFTGCLRYLRDVIVNQLLPRWLIKSTDYHRVEL